MVRVECQSEKLSQPGQLVFNEPLGSRPNVTIHTLDSRMRRIEIRRVLGRHDAVTDGAAKLRRVGE